jgi:hypothetical protein
MSPVSIFLNLLWILFGGLWMAAGWVIAAIIMAITIVGLPWARAAFNIAAYTLLPFGQKAVRRDLLTGQADIGTGPLGLIGNLIWLVLAGLVAGARTSRHRGGACRDHYRHSLRLGAPETRRHRAVADRQGDRSDLGVNYVCCRRPAKRRINRRTAKTTGSTLKINPMSQSGVPK